MRYDDAVASLYQVPLDRFVVERKRLAGELKTAGDKDGAAKLAKLARPPLSAWVIDQLWWQARAAFEALFETAQRLRDGRLDAMASHRDAIARLRAQAAKILVDAEHSATESTMRRVTQTLSALAASGGWEPDLPGALSADRDPPGFEVVGIPAVDAAHKPRAPAKADDAPTHRAATSDPAHRAATSDPAHRAATSDPAHRAATSDPAHRAATSDPAHTQREATDAAHTQREADAARERRDAADAQRRQEREAAAARAEAAAETRRIDAERAKAAAERNRIEAALRTAHGDVVQRQREVVKLERDLAAARVGVAQAKAVVEGLEERLAQLDN